MSNRIALSVLRFLQRLRRDERGGILIVGMVLGVMLVAIVFHVATIGEAIMWRENTQDGADTAAYEAALWNARGMNVIVQLNIFIAIFMALLMFWRLMLLFVTVILLVCIVMSFVPFVGPAFGALVGPLTTLEIKMQTANLKVTNRLYRVMGILHSTQKVVASATPLVSTAMSYVKVDSDKDLYGVDWGVGIGMQLFPVDLLPGRSGPKQTPPKSPNEPPMPCGVSKSEKNTVSIETLLGWPVSLPVQADEDEEDTLCSKGAIIQVMFVNQVLGPMMKKLGLPEGGRVGDAMRNTWSTIAESMSGVLCESLEGVAKERYEGAIDDACKDDPDRAKCEKETKEKSKNDAKGKKGPAAIEDAGEVHYTHPWFYTANGDLFMQSWGIVFAERPGADSELEHFARFPEIMGASADGAPELDDSAWQLAEAEMFFDCSDGWQSCSAQAPWTVNWRARLRRLHDPLDFAVLLGERVLVETFWNSIMRQAQRPPVSTIMSKLTGAMGSVAGKGGRVFSDAAVTTARSEIRERGKTATYDALRNTAARSAAMSLATGAIELEYIH